MCSLPLLKSASLLRSGGSALALLRATRLPPGGAKSGPQGAPSTDDALLSPSLRALTQLVQGHHGLTGLEAAKEGLVQLANVGVETALQERQHAPPTGLYFDERIPGAWVSPDHILVAATAPPGGGQAVWDTEIEPSFLYRRFLRGCLSADGKVLRVSTKDVPGLCLVTEDEETMTWAVPDPSSAGAGEGPTQAAGVSDWRMARAGVWAPTGSRYLTAGPRGAYVLQVSSTEVSLIDAIPRSPFDPSSRYVLDVNWLDSDTLIVHVPPDEGHSNALPVELPPQTWIYVLPEDYGS